MLDDGDCVDVAVMHVSEVVKSEAEKTTPPQKIEKIK